MRDLAVIQAVNRRPIFEMPRGTEAGWHLAIAEGKAILIGHGKRIDVDLADDKSLAALHRHSLPRSIKARIELIAVQFRRAELYGLFSSS